MVHIKPIASSICYNGRKTPGAETWPSFLPWPFLNTEYKCQRQVVRLSFAYDSLSPSVSVFWDVGIGDACHLFNEQASFFGNTVSKYPSEIQFFGFAFIFFWEREVSKLTELKIRLKIGLSQLGCISFPPIGQPCRTFQSMQKICIKSIT